MSSPVPRLPTFPGTQGLTTLQGRDTPREGGSGVDTEKNRHDRKRPTHAKGPRQILPEQTLSSPRTGGGTQSTPRPRLPWAERLRRFLAGGWLIRPRGGPGQLWPLPPWVPITWGCFSSRAEQRSLPPWPPSRPEPGESRGCTHVPSPLGANVGVPPTHTSRAGVGEGCFRADSGVHIPSSGVRALGTGSERVASGLRVTPADLEHAGRAGP